jgi:hypothetical protein
MTSSTQSRSCLLLAAPKFSAASKTFAAPKNPAPADLGLKSGLDLPAPIDSNRTDQARAGSENTSGRLMPSPEPVTPIRPTLRPAPGVVSMPGRPQTESSATPDEAARFSSRSWRSEAWDRERERELKALENPKAARRRAGS